MNAGSLNSVDVYNKEQVTAVHLKINNNHSSIRYLVNRAWSILYKGKNNLAIATGVIIENINTGKGNDTVTDNHVDNIINTGAGDDKIYLGHGGFDIVDGGAGNDTIYINESSANSALYSYEGGYRLLASDNWSVKFKGIERLIFSDQDIELGPGPWSMPVITLAGDNADNILTGTATNETMLGNGGNDTLIGNGGNDLMKGGSGNDIFVLNADNIANLGFDISISKVEGGTGTDILKIAGSDIILDLTTIANNRITSVEKIDLTGSGDNTLKLNLDDLLSISDTTNILKVFGDNGDKVDIDASQFTLASSTQIENGTTYKTYAHTTSANVVLWVDIDLAVV